MKNATIILKHGTGYYNAAKTKVSNRKSVTFEHIVLHDMSGNLFRSKAMFFTQNA